jgi:hypothetical protein
MRVLLVVVAFVAVAACGPKHAPPPRPPVEAPATDAVELRYGVGRLVQDVELQLTETRVGVYVEAEARLSAALELSLQGQVLRTQWTLEEIGPLELTGTVTPDEHHKARGLMLTRGKGVALGDVRGVVDTATTEADPINVTRLAAMDAKAPPAGVLLLGVLGELLRLPRLPAGPLRVGERAELEEESETVVVSAGAELVLPTTTVYRFTLRDVEEQGGARVAELELEVVSVAEPHDATAEPAVRLETRTEGTLALDLEAGVPVSLNLSRTEAFAVGKATGERSMTLRSRFRSP